MPLVITIAICLLAFWQPLCFNVGFTITMQKYNQRSKALILFEKEHSQATIYFFLLFRNWKLVVFMQLHDFFKNFQGRSLYTTSLVFHVRYVQGLIFWLFCLIDCLLQWIIGIMPSKTQSKFSLNITSHHFSPGKLHALISC